MRVIKHLSLEVDLQLTQFQVTDRRVQKIHSKTKKEFVRCNAESGADAGEEAGSFYESVPNSALCSVECEALNPGFVSPEVLFI